VNEKFADKLKERKRRQKRERRPSCLHAYQSTDSVALWLPQIGHHGPPSVRLTGRLARKSFRFKSCKSASGKLQQRHLDVIPRNRTFDFRSANEKPLLRLTDYRSTELRFVNTSAFSGNNPSESLCWSFVLSRGCDDPQTATGIARQMIASSVIWVPRYFGDCLLLSPQIFSNHFFEIGVFSSASNRGTLPQISG
jgi:hypothetical protein